MHIEEIPDYPEHRYRYPASRELRPALRAVARVDPQEYVCEGSGSTVLRRKARAGELGLPTVSGVFERDFEKARKPLSYVAEHYLQFRRQHVFM